MQYPATSMIVFGVSITDPAMYDRAAGPGIERAREEDSVVFPFAAAGSIYRSYNVLMDKAAELEGVEALVLVHQDAEIDDPEFCAKLRRAMADPDVGVVGSVGAIDVRSIAWWEGSVTCAPLIHRYSELGGGDVVAFSWKGQKQPAFAATGEVDSVDGFMLALSPWVIKNVRFDESLGQLHGYDFDFCLSVREAGKKIVTEDLYMIHHHSLDLISDPETWVEAHMRIAEKWDGRMPKIGDEGNGTDWKYRARRAEAEAAASRAICQAEQLKFSALERQVYSSISWRLTHPLRALNERRRRLKARYGTRLAKP